MIFIKCREPKNLVKLSRQRYDVVYRKLYNSNGGLFNNTKDLAEEIVRLWCDLSDDDLQKLCETISWRLMDLI